MGNDSGRGSRSNEPPKLATVRQLHLDGAEGSSATATDEWYETERLTGQITGRRNTPAIDQPTPPQSEALAVLDWRHASPPPPPRVRERLGAPIASAGRRVSRCLAAATALRRRRPARSADDGGSWARERGLSLRPSRRSGSSSADTPRAPTNAEAKETAASAQGAQRTDELRDGGRSSLDWRHGSPTAVAGDATASLAGDRDVGRPGARRERRPDRGRDR